MSVKNKIIDVYSVESKIQLDISEILNIMFDFRSHGIEPYVYEIDDGSGDYVLLFTEDMGLSKEEAFAQYESFYETNSEDRTLTIEELTGYIGRHYINKDNCIQEIEILLNFMDEVESILYSYSFCLSYVPYSTNNKVSKVYIKEMLLTNISKLLTNEVSNLLEKYFKTYFLLRKEVYSLLCLFSDILPLPLQARINHRVSENMDSMLQDKGNLHTIYVEMCENGRIDKSIDTEICE